ncbi:Vacuolar morphogenesis protein 6, partial [Ascosphaera atra]
AEQYCNKVHAALEAEGNFDSDELALGGAKSRGPSTRRSGDSGTSSPRSPQSASPFSFSRGHMKDRDDGSEPGKVLSIYHTLLSLYLSPPHDYAPQYGPALEILARHGSRLSADSTLSLIPESFPVHDLEFFFRRRMRASTSILNRSKIERGLRLVQNTAVTKELLLGDGAVPVAGEKKPRRSLGRSRSVVVNEERLCGMCHKRLGASVISVFPE